MSTVLLTTDGSDLATAAMTRAIDVLGRDHSFVALAVVPNAFLPAAGVSPMDTHPTVIDAQLEGQIEEEERKESVGDLAALDQTLGITSEHRLETGDPGATICDVAADIKADLVVIGSHGHGFLQRVLIGSVSNHVLHHCAAPVMVVKLEDTATR